MNKPKYKNRYNYRGLPCTVSNGKFSVCGQEKIVEIINGETVESTASGVLEWCRSEDDAKSRLTIMSMYEQFSNLSVSID